MSEHNGVKARLLALDDNLPLAEMISRVATRCGYEAKPIDNPDLLPQMLRDWKPTVLTLDLSMPREDGMSVLSVLEENSFTGKIVIVSGQEDWLRRAACRLAAGRGLTVARDMEKPVDLTELRRVLMSLHPAA